MVQQNNLSAVFQNKKALVLGLGKTGNSVVRFLQDHKIPFDSFDDNGTGTIHRVTDFSAYSVLLPAPGIPHEHPVFIQAQKSGLQIIGDIELFYLCAPKGKLIAITGTNGKSTTTALIHHILQDNQITATIGGNFGTPVLDLDRQAQAHVLETSSYQLELLDKTAFDIAVHLNITPDHLERHGTMENYQNAKARIFKNAKMAICGIDDTYSKQIFENLKQNKENIYSVSFLDKTARLFVENGILIFDGEKIYDCTQHPYLKGAHNYQNIACAFAACLAYGLKTEEITTSLKKFTGLEHRQKQVAVFKNIAFINDSKATNADATEKALLSYETIYWIVGGRQKQGGLNGLEKYLKRIKHSFIIGECSAEFAQWHEHHKAPYTLCDTIENAVHEATQKALADNLEKATVLLSPACASWDQYANFEKRGEDFIHCAQKEIQTFKDKEKT